MDGYVAAGGAHIGLHLPNSFERLPLVLLGEVAAVGRARRAEVGLRDAVEKYGCRDVLWRLAGELDRPRGAHRETDRADRIAARSSVATQVGQRAGRGRLHQLKVALLEQRLGLLDRRGRSTLV